VDQSAQAVAGWHKAHPVKSLILRTGLLKPPGALQQLEQRYGHAVRFLEGSQGRLQELEQAWTKKQVVYQQQLEREGAEIQEARRHLQVVVQNREQFQQVWKREDQSFCQERRDQEQQRSRDRGRDREDGAADNFNWSPCNRLPMY
jgi:phenylacetate-coenzyme A ligase PaaK-like adenylate-forming protein